MVASVRDGLNVVSQTIEYIPNEAGDFSTAEIRVQVLVPEVTSPAESVAPETAPSESSGPPPLRSDPLIVCVRPPRTLFWIFGGLGAPLFLGGVAWCLSRRKGRGEPAAPSTDELSFSAVQDALHRARKHRLDGRFYEYYTALSEASDLLCVEGETSEWTAGLSACAQDVGYRGGRPTDDEMDGHFRDVERALARRKEEQES